MSLCRSALGSLALWSVAVLGGCLPDNPSTETGTDGPATSTTEPDPTGGEEAGMLGCAAPPCTLLLVSQTLDDRIDIYDVGAAQPYLRGRIATDLKPDPTGLQTMGNLLDEPYGLVLGPDHLWAAIGHYPDTDRGSLVAFPRAALAEVAVGGVFSEDMYFQSGAFKAGVQSLPLERREAIFLLPHPSGRLLVGVFANDLRAADWPETSELLVVDPADLRPEAIGAFDLGALEKAPCRGGWKITALDPQVSKVAVACDGSESLAIVTLPGDFAAAAPADAAAGMSACGLNLAGGAGSFTQFVAGDGVGGLLAVQAELTAPPRLWNVGGDCNVGGPPGMDLPAELAGVRVVREPVLLRPAGEAAAVWLVASAQPEPGVLVVRGGPTPAVCGAVEGLDLLDAASNAPWALALDATRQHLAIGAGPPVNPELAEPRGQVLWASLDTADLDACGVTATDVVDLTAGSYQNGDPRTWVRAPNILEIAEIGGEAGG